MDCVSHVIMLHNKLQKCLEMLSPRLTNCLECNTIPSLLEKIDIKIAKLANVEYNNIVFALNYQIDRDAFDSLLNYKRILKYKYCNSDYASKFSIDSIASRVIELTFK